MNVGERDAVVRKWRRAPRRRPDSIGVPAPGQESVWDYPRPPRLERFVGAVRVEFAGQLVAGSDRAWRVLETASPPCFYLPSADVRTDLLHRESETTLCEWKGVARAFTLAVGGRESRGAAWSYPDPFPAFDAIRDHIAFFAGRVDGCFVDGRRVIPQPGSYYGGWITPDVVGPFKGGPGTEDW